MASSETIMQYASIYCRMKGESTICWVDGPLELNNALEKFHALVDDELTGDTIADEVLYYELRGVGRCAVRARARFTDWVKDVTYEVLSPVFPGRRVASERLSAETARHGR